MFRSVWNLMEPRIRWRFVSLVSGITLTSIWNIGGIAAIMPLIELLTNPEAATTNPVFGFLARHTGIVVNQSNITLVGLVVLLVFVTGNLLLAVVTWRAIDFARTIAFNISKRLFDTYLWQNYPFYLRNNTAELMKNIFTELANIMTGVLKPLIDLLVEGILAAGIIAFLILVNPFVAVGAAVVLGGGYGAIFLLFRAVLSRASRARVKWNREKHRVVSDAFGAIKELKLAGIESRYSKLFSDAAFRFERAKTKIQVISKLPRYALETLAFGGLLGLALVLFARGGDVGAFLPLLSAYVVAGYKLLPSLQRIFAAMANMRGSHASIQLIVSEIGRPIPPESTVEEEHIPFDRAINLENVAFSYEETDRPALHQISLEIEKNTTVGIAGPTGCGKTTLVDVLLGLHNYQGGEISVDGMRIDSGNARSWRRHFGYVPQTIYLSDTTIRHNIAFGIPDEEIDEERVLFVSKLAHLHDFVSTLPGGYETELGERGVRMSGGQRQRVGIARALYHDPDVLVFDEATSALDTRTEQAVMEAIGELMHQKTIIIIAHRLSTLRSADKIVVLRNGYVDTVGTYEELSETHAHFTQ